MRRAQDGSVHMQLVSRPALTDENQKGTLFVLVSEPEGC